MSVIGNDDSVLTANPEQNWKQLQQLYVLGLAGEIGWSYMQKGDGNATYRNRIIDAIYNMDKGTLDKGAKMRQKRAQKIR